MQNSHYYSISTPRIDYLKDICEAAYIAPSVPEAVFYFSCKLAGRFVTTLQPFDKLVKAPSTIYRFIVGDNENNLNTILKDTSSFKSLIIAPIAGIAIFTAVAFAGYNAVGSFAAKGAIAGIHTMAMLLFSRAAATEKDKFISLNLCLRRLFINDHAMISKQDCDKARIISFIVMAITSLSVTILTQNPILASAVAYPLSAVVNVDYLRFATHTPAALQAN